MGWGCSRSLNFHTWSMPFYTHVTRAVTHGGCFGKDWVGVGWGCSSSWNEIQTYCTDHMLSCLPTHLSVPETITSSQTEMRCFLAALLFGVPIIIVLPKREFHFVCREPSKNVTDLEGSTKIELSSRCGETIIFCNSQ